MHLIGKNKNFALLFFGSLVSEIGNVLYSFAMSLYIQDVTNSASAMGIFLAVSVAVRVLASPLAGWLVDRWNRIKIIYATDYIRAGLFLIAGLFMFTGASVPTIIAMLYTITILSSLNGALFGTSVTAAIPEIVGVDNLQAANSAQAVVGSFQTIVGLVLGAVVYSFLSLSWILIINAFTFLFSAISEMFIKTPYKEESISLQKSHDDDLTISASLKYMVKRKGLLTLLLFILFLNFAVTPLFSVGIPYYFKTLMSRDAFELSIFEIVFSVTMLIAGVVIGAIKIKSSNRVVKLWISILTVLFVSVAVLIYLQQEGILTYWVFYGLLLFVNGIMGVSIIFINVPINTGMVKAVDASYRGRVFSITGAASQVAIPFSMLIAGFIIDGFGIVALGLFCSVMVLIPAIAFVANRNLTNLFNELDQTKKAPEPQSEIEEAPVFE